MEAICYSKTSVDFNGLHGIVSQKIEIFENLVGSISLKIGSLHKSKSRGSQYRKIVTSERSTTKSGRKRALRKSVVYIYRYGPANKLVMKIGFYKVKLFPCLIKNHTIKIYRGVGESLHCS
jgi:hypothetical protein